MAAADGLITKPEVRGDFDKMTIDCITEAEPHTGEGCCFDLERLSTWDLVYKDLQSIYVLLA